jgi:regulatory protein
MAVSPSADRRRPPLDDLTLEELSLRYVGRYATSRARLAAYLRRKIIERGWSGSSEPPIGSIVEKLASLGYVDDSAFASARASALTGRGYGLRRVDAALRAAGIEIEDAEAARETARTAAWESALRLARRRGIGPFAAAEPDAKGRERWIGILLRAGHSFDLARRIAWTWPGEIPDEHAL